MTPLGERIGDLANSLCQGKRCKAANDHVSGIGVVAEITGQPFMPSPYFSFLAGWDAAMATRSEDIEASGIMV